MQKRSEEGGGSEGEGWFRESRGSRAGRQLATEMLRGGTVGRGEGEGGGAGRGARGVEWGTQPGEADDGG
ncbi:hypothetical protein KM043_013731 [Ampulex compressa]|nr:hypothetical protein KM043_013731 [Ampulex compressa]